jgi:hypothetical protein
LAGFGARSNTATRRAGAGGTRIRSTRTRRLGPSTLAKSACHLGTAIDFACTWCERRSPIEVDHAAGNGPSVPTHEPTAGCTRPFGCSQRRCSTSPAAPGRSSSYTRSGCRSKRSSRTRCPIARDGGPWGTHHGRGPRVNSRGSLSDVRVMQLWLCTPLTGLGPRRTMTRWKPSSSARGRERTLTETSTHI